jgi:hypothetical protein
MTHVLRAALMVSAASLAACSAPPVDQAATNLSGTNEVDAISVIDEPENAAAPADGTALTPDGLGALRIGMTRAQVVAAMGDAEKPDPDPEACEQFHPARAPAGVLVMVEDGKLTRISLIEGTVRTDAGLGIGASAAQVKAAYGAKARSTRHHYIDPPAEYITVWTKGTGGPGSLGTVYEVGDDGKVFAIHAGGPSIQYVEGCL